MKVDKDMLVVMLKKKNNTIVMRMNSGKKYDCLMTSDTTLWWSELTLKLLCQKCGAKWKLLYVRWCGTITIKRVINISVKGPLYWEMDSRMTGRWIDDSFGFVYCWKTNSEHNVMLVHCKCATNLWRTCKWHSLSLSMYVCENSMTRIETNTKVHLAWWVDINLASSS